MSPKWSCVALVLAGCGDAPLPVCFHERFDTLDADRWKTFAVPDAVRSGEVAIVDHGLAITPQARLINLHVQTVERFDLRGGFAEVELTSFTLVGATGGPSDVQSQFVVGIAPEKSFRMISAENGVYFQHVPGASTMAPAGSLARYARFVHDAGANTIGFQTSPDHVTWTPQGVPEPAGFSDDALYLDLEVDTFNNIGTLATAGTAGFDNVIVAAPSCDPHDRGPGLP